MNLLIFFNIIFQFIVCGYNNECDKGDSFYKKLKTVKIFFSTILSIIILFLLDLLCFTDYNLQKVLNNKMKKKKFVKIYKIYFSIYYIFMFIIYILSMCFSHKRYDYEDDDFYGDQRKDTKHLIIEIIYSIFIYLIILPVLYCLC